MRVQEIMPKGFANWTEYNRHCERMEVWAERIHIVLLVLTLVTAYAVIGAFEYGV